MMKGSEGTSQNGGGRIGVATELDNFSDSLVQVVSVAPVNEQDRTQLYGCCNRRRR